MAHIIPTPSAIICGVEGTSSSIRFNDELFLTKVINFAKECLTAQWDSEETQNVMIQVRKFNSLKHTSDPTIELIPNEAELKELIIEATCRYLTLALLARDSSEDIIALKILVAFYCYKNNYLIGHVYDDVKESFADWKSRCIKIGTFSATNNLLQKMQFAYSCFGNCHQFVDDYFSPSIVGIKSDMRAYKNIAERLNLELKEIVYISDSVQELVAAKKAGMYPLLMIRRHNHELYELRDKLTFKYIRTFKDLKFM